MVARTLLVFAALALSAVSHAAELKILTAGAFKSVLVAYAPAFEQQSGHKLIIDNDTAGGLVRRIRAGEAFDVAVLTNPALDDLARSGEVAAAKVPVARVGVGVAVKRGAPLPDISTTAAFTQALLNARAVATIDPAAGGTSGIYLAQLFERLGIADRIKPKAVLVPGGYTADKLVSGEADIAVQQMSELVAVPGAQVVGPLPADIQSYTIYSVSAGSAARDRAAAQQLIAALQSDAVRGLLADRGLAAP